MDIETSNISSLPEQAAESSQALDALFKQATTETPEGTPTATVPEPTTEPKVEPKETPAAVAPAVVDPPVTAPEAEVKPKETPAAAAPKDALDDVQLPPYSKPKTGEAFEKVKSLARETISQKETELAQLRKDLSDREEKLKGVPTQEQQKEVEALKKEVEELRNFRRASAIENDPSFKAEYDGKIESNNNTILAKLAEAGMSPENIEAAKKMGVENVDWEPVLSALPPAMRGRITGLLGANLELRDSKAAAIEAARKEPSKFESQRVEAQSKALTESANSFLKRMAWSAEKQVPANATPEQKTEIEAHNKIAKDAQALVQTALKDYSPEVFAELAVGTAAAHKYKADYTALKASSDAATTKHKTEIETVTKERDTFKAELDKIKKAGRTHIQNGSRPSVAPADPFAMNGSDALDKLRGEVAD